MTDAFAYDTYVGHSQLYFLCTDGSIDGNWCITKFSGEDKNFAIVYFYDEKEGPDKNTLEVYNQETVTFHDVEGYRDVVLNGNFNESIALAEQIAKEKNWPKYNLITNNCADYTDKILEV